MRIKKPRTTLRGFFARRQLPGFPGFPYTLPVVLYGNPYDLLVRAVHYEFAPTTGTGLQTFDTFQLEAFHPRIDRYARHFCLFANGFRDQS